MSRRRLLVCACALAALAACVRDDIVLRRGPLGPATYRVRLAVSGAPAIRADTVTARLRVSVTPRGADLRLAVAGQDPIQAVLTRSPTGQLALDAVQGVPPSSAGEVDLASIVGQIDPPLPRRPVRLRQRWTSTRTIRTETIAARLTSRLRVVRFRRVGSRDTAEIEGTVTGRLRTSGSSGVYDGSVEGRTTMWWALDAGRVAASRTRLVWRIEGTGQIVVLTDVDPG